MMRVVLSSIHHCGTLHSALRLSFRRVGGWPFGLETHLVAVSRDAHGLAGQNLAAQQLRRERVLYERLYRALQGARAVERVVALAREQLFRRVVEFEAHVALLQHPAQSFELYLDDVADLLARELVEDDYVVNAVQELRLEVLAQDLCDGLAHLLLVVAHLLNLTAPKVRGHNQDRVLEVHRAPLRVGQATVVENLQQDVENVRMRLLYLVEEDDAVGAASDGLGQLPALLVADVTGRCSDHARDGVLLHVLRHVEAYHRPLVVEQKFCERACGFSFADAGGPEEDERADGAVRVLEACARAAHRVGDSRQSLVLTDDALAQTLLHRDELLHLAFEHLRDGHARPLGDDLRDVLLVNLFLEEDAVSLKLGQLLALLGELAFEFGNPPVLKFGGARQVASVACLLQLDAQLLKLVLGLAHPLDLFLLGLPLGLHPRRGLFEIGDALLDVLQAGPRAFVLFALQRLALNLQLQDFAFEHVNLLRQRVYLDAQARGRLVYEVYGLVGQEAVCDVSVRESRRRDDGRVLDADAVVQFVAFFQSAEDGDCVLHARLADEDGLEATLERRVLLDVLLILVQRRRADAAQLAARERGLEHVRRVNRAFGCARADERVQLVNEEDDLPLRVLNLFEDCLQTVFKLAAILRAREHRAEVERDQALVAQGFGNVAGDDSLRETFDDCRLADARLAYEHGVVLRPAREDLNRPAYLVVATDDGVELPLAREVGQVFGVLRERLVVGLRVLVSDADAAAHVVYDFREVFAVDAVLPEYAPGGAVLLVGDGG